MSEPDIILTKSAAKRVAWIAERQHKAAILRLAVDGGGCAGFTYKFELADLPRMAIPSPRPTASRWWSTP